MDYKANVAEVAAQKITYATAGGTVLLGLTANEFAAIGGLLVAVLALLVNAGINIYFKRQHLRIARERATRAPFPGLFDEASGD